MGTLKPHAIDSGGLVRGLNEQLILETVFVLGPISRAGIARKTGLSKPTVSSVVSGLEDSGLLQQDGESTGGMGRPAVLYRVAADAGYVFAVDIGGTKILGGIADLFGRMVAEIAIPTPSEATGAGVVAEVVRLFNTLLSDTGLDRGLVRASAIGVPGIVDPVRGRVTAAYNLTGLQDVALHQAFTSELSMPVSIENDVNLAAVGERWRGRAVEHDTFVAISIGTGVGMGIIIDGEIYRGARGAAGEIDFLPLAADPFDWPSHGHGPFEAEAAAPAILRRFRYSHPPTPTRLPPDAGVPDIFAAASDDELAKQLFDDEARRIALAIAAVTATLDPALVILGGGVGANQDLCDAVRTYVDALTPRPPEIEVSSLGPRGAFVGAVAAALRLMRAELLADVAATR